MLDLALLPKEKEFGEVRRGECHVLGGADDHTLFLKTIIPSRKATKEYLGEKSDDET